MTTPSFTIDKTAFAREIALALGCMDNKTTIPAIGHALLVASELGLSITGTNLIVSLNTRADLVKLNSPGAICVPAKRLHAFLSTAPDGEAKVSVSANQRMTVVIGSAKATIPCMDADQFPELPAAPDTLAEVPLHPFARLIHRTSFAISKEESRFSLQACLCEFLSDQVRMTTTDGHRMSQAAMKCNPGGPETKTLIPFRALSEIRRLAGIAPLDAHVAVSIRDNQIFFRVGERLLTTQKITGSFPDWKRFIKQDMPSSVRLSREALQDAIQRVRNFTDENTRKVRLSISNESIGLSADIDAGEGEDSISVTEVTIAAPIEIGFNGDYITDFLRTSDADDVKFEFQDESRLARFAPWTSGETESHFCLIMPMRV